MQVWLLFLQTGGGIPRGAIFSDLIDCGGGVETDRKWMDRGEGTD